MKYYFINIIYKMLTFLDGWKEVICWSISIFIIGFYVGEIHLFSGYPTKESNLIVSTILLLVVLLITYFMGETELVMCASVIIVIISVVLILMKYYFMV